MNLILLSTLGCILSGLSMRIVLQFCNQVWVRSYQTTVTYMVLPVVTYVITNVISNNIALSLGMVGALSIVRFRNPVKSSLELAIYFALITIGIAYSVNYKWAILLNLIVLIALLLTKILDKIFRNKNKFLFSLSFNEGQNLNFLEVSSAKPIEHLENSKFLINSFEDKDNSIFNYKLSSDDESILREIKKKTSSIKSIKSIDLTYGH